MLPRSMTMCTRSCTTEQLTQVQSQIPWQSDLWQHRHHLVPIHPAHAKPLDLRQLAKSQLSAHADSCPALSPKDQAVPRDLYVHRPGFCTHKRKRNISKRLTIKEHVFVVLLTFFLQCHLLPTKWANVIWKYYGLWHKYRLKKIQLQWLQKQLQDWMTVLRNNLMGPQ